MNSHGDEVAWIVQEYRARIGLLWERGHIDCDNIGAALRNRVFFDWQSIKEPIPLEIHNDYFVKLSARVTRLDHTSSETAFTQLEKVLHDEFERCRTSVLVREYLRRVTKPLPDEKRIREYLAELAGASKDELHAGLAVLATAAFRFLSQLPEEQRRHLRPEMLFEVTEQVRKHNEVDFEQVTSTLIEPDLVSLTPTPEHIGDTLRSASVITSERKRVGKRYFAEFKKRLRRRVCDDPRGPWHLWNNMNVRHGSNIGVSAATVFLDGAFTAHEFWYPLAVYGGTLILTSGLDAYCGKSPRFSTAG